MSRGGGNGSRQGLLGGRARGQEATSEATEGAGRAREGWEGQGETTPHGGGGRPAQEGGGACRGTARAQGWRAQLVAFGETGFPKQRAVSDTTN